ncbi:GIY-YIG nuclease family protein [Microcystis aeruginosa CS-555/01A07]|uniref:GIY-YIG nuclease family protein n=1 Tax=Microcystis aeruginosa TaxID=1126 RepID=UPI00232D7A84|nr:GIY-YIG nuclease family protein [Microcystis aeruginosa]MDB9430953.1 GIY-YIG nuclease family protein [Microcystis aeruginosa CS-555/01A07]
MPTLEPGFYSGKRLSEIQTKLCLAWFIARDTVPHTTAHRYSHIPDFPGIYAVRHRSQGLLYIGKTKSLRGRFKGGHKAFLWAWLDQYNSEDVRLAVQTIPYWKNPALLLELEAIILRATEPPYNVQIPMES